MIIQAKTENDVLTRETKCYELRKFCSSPFLLHSELLLFHSFIRKRQHVDTTPWLYIANGHEPESAATATKTATAFPRKHIKNYEIKSTRMRVTSVND